MFVRRSVRCKANRTLRVAELIGFSPRLERYPGDNFLVDLDLSVDAVPVGTRLQIGGALV